MKEGRGGVLLKHPSRGRVGCHRPYKSDRRLSTSRAIKSGGWKSARVSYMRRYENLACFPRADVGALGTFFGDELLPLVSLAANDPPQVSVLLVQDLQ